MTPLVRQLSVLIVLAANLIVAAQDKKRPAYPPTFRGADTEVYKTVGDAKLNIYIFLPGDHQPTDRRSAIVFFFGGGWRSGNPAQFEQHCRYLAGRGMVAMTADYRVASRHQTKATACVADGKSAIRWVRQHARRLGVDPDRVAAGGGSAGGHVAACTGVVPGFEETPSVVSSVPNAMVLFNPAVVLAPIDNSKLPFDKDRYENLIERFGAEPRELSPYHHVAKDQPPTIIFHGKGDTTVKYETVELFTARMVKQGNRCVLKGYEDQGHGFFNHGRGGNEHYHKTVRAMDEFLVSLGFLTGPPTIE